MAFEMWANLLLFKALCGLKADRAHFHAAPQGVGEAGSCLQQGQRVPRGHWDGRQGTTVEQKKGSSPQRTM